MDALTLRQIPRCLLLIAANALPVYGAFTGRLVFFQVLWLYWLESLLLIGFDAIRVLSASGTGPGPKADAFLIQALKSMGDSSPLSFWTKLGLAFRNALIRLLILGFYLSFLIVFVGLQVTDDSHALAVERSIAFQDAFVNTALCIFVINGSVQLIAGFFLNGLFRTVSPRLYVDIIGPRTIIMHVMIVSSVFIHRFFFESKSYAWIGEAVYVGMFMLIRTVLDIRSLRRQEPAGGQEVVMI